MWFDRCGAIGPADDQSVTRGHAVSPVGGSSTSSPLGSTTRCGTTRASRPGSSGPAVRSTIGSGPSLQGHFSITPYLTDRSAFDAQMLLVDCGGALLLRA